MIIKEDKLFFIHIPKTAGSSIEKAINGDNPLWGRHYSFETFCSYPKKYIAREYFVFTVVRNPWDRIYSCFLWSKHLRRENLFWCDSFDDYLKYVEGYESGVGQSNIFIEDFNWWTGGSENLDHVARFENLESDLEPIREHVGRDFILPHLNKNPSRKRSDDYRFVYTPYWIDMIREKYKTEIESFDYTFKKIP